MIFGGTVVIDVISISAEKGPIKFQPWLTDISFVVM